jgi:CRP-like cAMP-binding protein
MPGMVDDERVAVLTRVPLFAGLDAHAVRDVADASSTHDFAAGRVVFSEGDQAHSFFVVRSGSVKLAQLTAEGHVVVLRLIGPGDPFGGAAAFSGGTYPISAEAVTATSVFEWPGPRMAALMERHPRIAINAVRFVAAQLHDLQVRYRQLATEKVERRIARALLRLVQHAGRKVENGVLIDLPLSREDIAQMTGTTLYTVSRVLSRWEADGVLDAGRQRIVVQNPHALVAAADEFA